jgi:hypothetical protein
MNYTMAQMEHLGKKTRKKNCIREKQKLFKQKIK